MEIIEPIGTFIGMVIFFPAMMLVMHLFMGLVSLLFSPFSGLYIGVIGFLFVFQIIIPKNIRIITTAALSLGIIMMWVSLFASYQGLPYNYIDFSNPAPAALGGFPITVFEYPPAALGSDVPPLNTWGLFYLNLSFWLVIGAGVAMILRKYLNNQVSFKLTIASVVISLYGLGYLGSADFLRKSYPVI